MPLDYSKWKTIEVSDDEDDTHPNIDTPSLFRWRHQARLERMAERKQEKEKLMEEKSNAEKRIMDVRARLERTDLDEKERMKLELEIEEVRKQEEEYMKKEKELEEKEKLEPWNVDTIGHEAFSKSRINKITGEKPAPPKLSEEEETKRMDEKMCNIAEQCIIIQYLLELSKTLHALATNTNVIKNFFKKFRAADPSYLKVFRQEVDAFCDRLRKRGKDKRDAAIAEYEAEEKAKRIAASPGGLDPQEMRAAFDSQEVSRLQEVAQKMDREVFSYHLGRCIDSGLWIPDANAAKEGEGDQKNDS
ncbi:unnamed protein product [Gongylonema pulchrum]|uniref:Hsp90 chaperone protein kinase-targeting subunit n=1 Tax=Gongylonema pulchrum TaxID=637853 RepID=A0A183DRK5_9BILA|nr:unnamed protein product [Gongylonema pulchrum]